jgi:hypothetical protein
VTLVVYSTIFGRTDPLHEPLRPGNTRFVMFTDQPLVSKHWEIIRVGPFEAPKRECRKLKQPSHLVFPEADATLWIDASYTLLVDPLSILAQYPGEMYGFRHHKRDRIKDEAPAIVAAGKGKADAIYAQLAAYQADGWDTDANPQREITNGGFLLRRSTDTVRSFNDLWHHEVQTRTLRDQMSIDYCAHKAGVGIQHLPGSPKANPFARIHYCKNPTNDF